MKRCTPIILLLVIVFCASQVIAQDDNNLFDEIKEYAEAEAEEALSPVVQAFGTGVTGGLYNTAKTHGVLGFDVGVRAMMVTISNGEGVLDSVDISMFPVPVIQASVGLPMDFEVMVRGFGAKFDDETISLFGVGVKKNFNHLIPVPAFPDVSAMIAYHKFKGSDILTSSHLSFDLMVSKSFVIVTPYAGFGIDRHSMDIEYTWVDPYNVLPDENLDLSIKETTTRLTLGLNVTPFPFVKLFADYNIGKFSEITAGLAVSIR